MRRYIWAVICFYLSGCASLGMQAWPGSIKETVSGFDKTLEIYMEPAPVDTSEIRLGLFKNSKMDKDKAILTVVINWADLFSEDESIEFNIDGKIIGLKSMDLLTHIETKDTGTYLTSGSSYNESSKRYEVSKDFIKQLIDGKEVWVKLHLEKEYLEGKFSKDSFSTARPAFKKFYERVWDSENIFLRIEK